MVNRNRTMKDSKVKWIGGIPDNWEVKPLKYIANIQTGNTPSMKNKHYYSDNGIDWVKTNNLLGTKGVKESEVKLSIEGSKVARIAKAHSTLVSCIGDVGKMGYITLDSAYNQQINAVTFNEDDVFWKYGMYYISVQKEQHQYYQNGNVLKILNTENQKRVVVPVPKIEEQKKIAAFLDGKVAHINNIIEDTKKSIENLKAYKQSLITETVTKGLDPNIEMKDSGIEYIGKIPKNWSLSKLGYLGNLQNGISKAGDFFGSGYPFVSYGDVYKNSQLPSNVSGLIESNSVERERYSVEYGDVFFTRTSETIEEVGFVSTCLKTIDNAVFAGFLIRFRPNDDQLEPSFSKYYFRSNLHRKYFVKEMNIVTRASLSQSLLKKLPVLLPSKEEQLEIAQFLFEKTTHITSIIEQKEQLITELESYKKSLIYECVTGKKEVK